MSELLRLTQILEVALYADDLDAAESFYVDTLGFEKHARVGNRHLFLRLESLMLLLFNPNETIVPFEYGDELPIPTHGAIGPGHVCFKVPEGQMDAWERKLASLNIKLESDFRWPNGVRSIYFRDPAGNSIELAPARLWGFE